MRRALLLLPRLQPCSPAVARTFSSKASVTLQTPDAEVDATEDHSRESMVANTVALMEEHLNGLRSIKASLEKVRPKVPSDLIFSVSNAAADARELKSAASFIFKADAKLIAKMEAAKKPKDPNAPKRALTGYSLFVKEVSSEIRAATPNTNAIEVMKTCGAKWSALSPQQKQEWNAKAKQ